VAHFALAFSGHNFDLDMVVSFGVLKVAEVLQIAVSFDALVIFVLRIMLHLKLSIRMKSAVLDLKLEIISIVIGAIPVF
jgi:hypothetical protein